MRYIATTLFTLFCAFTVQAQTFIGIRGGLNYSKVNGIGSINNSYNWKEGYHMGVFLHSRIGDKLYLQPEILYTSRGYDYSRHYSQDKAISGDTVSFLQNTTLTYLDVPLLTRLQYNNIYFEVGPQFGLILNGKSENQHMLNRNGETEYSNSSYNTKELVEPIDIGFVFGLGYQMNAGLGASIRYNQGFREVIRGINWQKNVLLQATASYIFGYSSFINQKANSANTGLNNQEVYYKPSKGTTIRTSGYRIIAKQNVQRISIVKTGVSTKSEIHYKFNSGGGRTPTNILISGSSGIEEQTILFKGFRDIGIPFKGVLKYVVPSSFGQSSIEGYLEIEITEPGIWRVNILTQ